MGNEMASKFAIENFAGASEGGNLIQNPSAPGEPVYSYVKEAPKHYRASDMGGKDSSL